MVASAKSIPWEFPTVRVAANVPGLLYFTKGFWKVEVDGEPPLKFQSQVVGSFRLLSIKGTKLPGQTWVTGVNIPATGGLSATHSARQAGPAALVIKLLITLID